MSFGINFNNKKEKKENHQIFNDQEIAERENKKENCIYLADKFTEKIKENPIIIYLENDNKEKVAEIILNEVKKVNYDESEAGGGLHIDFNNNIYFYVNINEIDASPEFNHKDKSHKITKESLNNILDMIEKLVIYSGCSEKDKNNIYQLVVNNFKNKIIEG